METISKSQLLIMIALFQIGTTITFGFSAEAGRDAWISVLTSIALGMLVILMYTYLMRMHPGLTLVQWFPAEFGKWIGVPLSWLYPLLFLYDSGRMIADLKDLIKATILPRTPPLFCLGIFMCLIAFALYHGIEAFGRTCQIAFPVLITTYVIEIILISASDIARVQNLLPVLDQGFRKVWNSVWPTGITQTYGQSIVFAMFWPLLKEKNHVIKTAVAATLISGTIILSADLIGIMVLGEGLFQSSVYPIYSVTRLVKIGDFVEHLDALGAIYFINTVFFKITATMLAAIYGIRQLAYMKNHHALVVPVSIFVLFEGLTMTDNLQEHIYGVHMKILSPYLWGPVYLGFPAVLFLVTWIRRTTAGGLKS